MIISLIKEKFFLQTLREEDAEECIQKILLDKDDIKRLIRGVRSSKKYNRLKKDLVYLKDYTLINYTLWKLFKKDLSSSTK